MFCSFFMLKNVCRHGSRRILGAVHQSATGASSASKPVQRNSVSWNPDRRTGIEQQQNTDRWALCDESPQPPDHQQQCRRTISHLRASPENPTVAQPCLHTPVLEHTSTDTPSSDEFAAPSRTTPRCDARARSPVAVAMAPQHGCQATSASSAWRVRTKPSSHVYRPL